MPRKYTKKKKAEKANLDEMKNDSDNTLDKLAKGLAEDDLGVEREGDEDADFEDSATGKIAASKEKREAKKEAEKESRGKVMAGGMVKRDKAGRPKGAPEIDPKRTYSNYPIKTIDGNTVQFVGARPVNDRKCAWDEDCIEDYDHFTETDHPNYHNAVYAPTQYKNFKNELQNAFVIKTSKEIQLFIAV